MKVLTIKNNNLQKNKSNIYNNTKNKNKNKIIIDKRSKSSEAKSYNKYNTSINRAKNPGERLYENYMKRLDNARERESDELFDYISNRKIHQDKITKKELENIFQNYKLGVDAEDLDKMLSYMTDNNDDDTEKNDELLFEENEEDEEYKHK